MHTHRETYHLIRRDMLILVFRVWMIHKRQVIYGVQFLAAHSRVGGIDYHTLIAYCLHNGGSVDLVALRFNDSEILRMHTFALYCRFMATKLTVDSSYLAFARTITRRARVRQLIIEYGKKQ